MEFDAVTIAPTYRFHKGLPGRSYGLAIARRLGVDPAVVAQAEAQVPEGERVLDALLHEVERRDQRLREREAALGLELEQTAEKAAELEARLTDVEEREQEVRRQERGAAAQARNQARDYLLEARKRVEAAIARAEQARSAEEEKAARRSLELAISELSQAEASGAFAARSGSGVAVQSGSRVRLQTGTIGRVEEIRDDGKVVVLAGSVRMVVSPDSVAETLPEARERAVIRTSAVPEDASAQFEIDLRGLRVDEAEAVTISAIDQAVLADQPYLRIIHGKGTGAVRSRVHELLKGDRRVSRYALAPTNQGGSGATIAEFRR
jgi:DNA mismatch repair protein MutS2